MRFDGSRDGGWSARDVGDDFAFQILTGEIVEIFVGNSQAVADENDRSSYWCGIAEGKEEAVFAEMKGFGLSVVDYFQRGLRRVGGR
jgi:hypothetical protein